MKKFLRYILIILIAFCLNFSNKTIFASENNEYSLQVERGEYSDEILDYIRNNWENFFERDELKKFLGSDIIVGEPYGIYSVDEDKFIATKFPIYVKGNCVQVLDVFENPKTGKLTWAASTDKDFMKVIDDLNKKTGKYRFETKYSSTGGADTLDIVKIEEQGFRSFKDAIYSDISKPLLKIKVRNINEKPALRSSNYPVEKILPMDLKKSQDNKPWCVAYVVLGFYLMNFLKILGLEI